MCALDITEREFDQRSDELHQAVQRTFDMERDLHAIDQALKEMGGMPGVDQLLVLRARTEISRSLGSIGRVREQMSDLNWKLLCRLYPDLEQAGK